MEIFLLTFRANRICGDVEIPEKIAFQLEQLTNARRRCLCYLKQRKFRCILYIITSFTEMTLKFESFIAEVVDVVASNQCAALLDLHPSFDE